MTIRVLDLAEQLEVETDDLLAICTLLEIPATSRISCLTNEHINKIHAYYEKETLTKFEQWKPKPIAELKTSEPDKDQPWLVWDFAAGLNIVA